MILISKKPYKGEVFFVVAASTINSSVNAFKKEPALSPKAPMLAYHHRIWMDEFEKHVDDRYVITGDHK